MDWIPALLKQFGVSRSLVVAVFVTSLVLYLGPRLAPLYIEAVPREWASVIVGALVFSGFLVLLWPITFTTRLARSSRKKIITKILACRLSKNEIDILLAMAVNTEKPVNLENVNYEEMNTSRLTFTKIMHDLSNKGLVPLNPFSRSLVSLTDAGWKIALKI